MKIAFSNINVNFASRKSQPITDEPKLQSLDRDTVSFGISEKKMYKLLKSAIKGNGSDAQAVGWMLAGKRVDNPEQFIEPLKDALKVTESKESIGYLEQALERLLKDSA